MGPHDGRALHEYDHERAERAVKELLLAIGEDPEREGLKDTPARVARAFKENFAGLWQSPNDVLTTTFTLDTSQVEKSLGFPKLHVLLIYLLVAHKFKSALHLR